MFIIYNLFTENDHHSLIKASNDHQSVSLSISGGRHEFCLKNNNNINAQNSTKCSYKHYLQMITGNPSSEIWLQTLQTVSICSAEMISGWFLCCTRSPEHKNTEKFINFMYYLGKCDLNVYKHQICEWPATESAPEGTKVRSGPEEAVSSCLWYSVRLLGPVPYCAAHDSLPCSDAVAAAAGTLGHDSVFAGRTFRLLRTSCAVLPSMPCMSQTKR